MQQSQPTTSEASKVELNAKLRRPPNTDLRPREYLTEDEMKRLLVAAKKMQRYSHRNFTLLLISYRHGLRAGEASRLLWSDVELKRGRLHIRRLKEGNPGVHPMKGDEIRALRQLRREYPDARHLFVSERGGNLTVSAIRQVVAAAGKAAGLPFQIHSHVLRHSCGYALASAGVDVLRIKDWLGHVDLSSTAVYAQLAPNRFENVWKD